MHTRRSGASEGNASDGSVATRLSGGARQRVRMQNRTKVNNNDELAKNYDASCANKTPLSRETGPGGDETSAPPATTPQDIFTRVIFVIGLSLTLFAVGTLLFISGFFLSRDDLPYVSNGQAIPFPPLFPHLDPARLRLNKEESVYYVEESSPGAPRSGGEQSKADGAPRPVYLEEFTDPQLVPVSSEQESCPTQPCGSSWVSVTPYDRAVVFLIDAMRFDFLLWDPEASTPCEDDYTKECAAAPSDLRPFYRNRMPFAHDLLRRSDADLQQFLYSLLKGRAATSGVGDSSAASQDTNPLETQLPPGIPASQARSDELPSNGNWGGNRFARLYIFEADPPTATTQRLLGLATGSMPSFFSVRETFSASAVDVDSLLLQLKAANKTSVAIGDDTWDRSFGHLLTRLRVFPSLNIRDLNTVDSRVASELPREFAKGDWTFLVGHVLGVDHVGHAAVLDSRLMHKKLAEMNDMLKSILKLTLTHGSNTVSNRPTNTLFLVFGDHGMTEAGSHGGGSSEESIHIVGQNTCILPWDSPLELSYNEVEAGLFSFSTLPAILSTRTAQMLSPSTRLFTGRLPRYLQNHGAFHGSSWSREVGSGPAIDGASPTAALGYGSRRVRQVGLAPTLSLLLGLPIPFNSMGRIIEDIVPTIASFVQECAPEIQGASLRALKCSARDGKQCSAANSEDAATARTVRCSDLAYLAQLHHIVAWQQHRAVMTHAALTGNGAVLSDPQFAAAKARWLRLYSELDKEIKSLPPAAHTPLTPGSSTPTFKSTEQDLSFTLPTAGFEYADAELISNISQLSHTGGDDKSGYDGDARLGINKEAPAGAASILPSLIPYLRASADFSQEAWQASVRQLCTFNIMLMFCGILMALCSFIILGLAARTLRNPFSGCAKPTLQAWTACTLPDSATIARWLCMSACIAGGTWALGWASLKVFKPGVDDSASVLEAFLWHQLPALCLTGALCSVVVPFAWSTLFLHSGRSAQRGLHQDSTQTELGPIASAFSSFWMQDMCLSHMWLALFNAGKLHCYAALFVVCIVPFSDCYVERECAIVRFLFNFCCIWAGATVYATPSTNRQKKQIIAALAALVFCVRIGNGFDPFERSVGKASANAWPLQIDSTSASVFLMFCIYCVVGMEEFPFVARLFGRGTGDRCGESEKKSRFRIASFHPLRGRKGARSCTFERDIFLVQGAIALLWFAFPHDSKSQQPTSQGSQHNQEGDSSFILDALVFLWSVIVFPFKVIDAAGASFLGWLTDPGPWLFTAPRCLLGIIPSQLLDGGQVKVVPLLNVLLPWVIYLLTAGLWMRLVLILCRMKKRENDISRQQLCSAKEELISLGDNLNARGHVDGPSQQTVQRRESGVCLWSIELWEYFAHYLFFAAICPLCMFAVLLGRVQLWPLLLCCIKWRLLLFLGRVLVVPPTGPPGQECDCSFCRVLRDASPDPATYATDCRIGISSHRGHYRRPKHKMHFLLSDGSFCMMAALLVLDTFFVTGHRTKLSALPIEAGFVGLLEFHPLWSFVTSFFHTYAVYMIGCPLVFMLLFLRTAHLATDKSTPIAKALRGSTPPAVVQTTALMIGKVSLRILMGVTFKHFCSLVSLTLLRHHLFIWDLFAVKFLYDTTAAFLMYVLIVLTLITIGIGAQRTIKVILST